MMNDSFINFNIKIHDITLYHFNLKQHNPFDCNLPTSSTLFNLFRWYNLLKNNNNNNNNNKKKLIIIIKKKD